MISLASVPSAVPSTLFVFVFFVPWVFKTQSGRINNPSYYTAQNSCQWI
jgi:hypothetical protein